MYDKAYSISYLYMVFFLNANILNLKYEYLSDNNSKIE